MDQEVADILDGLIPLLVAELLPVAELQGGGDGVLAGGVLGSGAEPSVEGGSGGPSELANSLLLIAKVSIWNFNQIY